MNAVSSPGTAVVTGASSGIGKIYAERLARRGYDLILVARNRERLDALAAELAAATGRKVDVLAADLGRSEDVVAVAARIEADADRIDAMVQLNVVALTRLAVAAVNAFTRRGQGTLVNIASVVALMPENFPGAYAATKAYVLALTQSLQSELKDGPVRIQAVLPGLTRTEFFDRAGLDVNALPAHMVMAAEDLVDAALAGLDLGETITIPSLPDTADWEAAVVATRQLGPHLSLSRPAARYGVVAAA